MNTEKIQQVQELLDSFKLSNNLLDIKEFNSENFNNLSDKLSVFVNIPKIKSSNRISLKLIFINNFNESLEHTSRFDKSETLFKYLIFNKITEIIRLNNKPMVFLTLLKNSLAGEPNYNILQKLKTAKGYQIHKILNILFSNTDDMMEFVKIQQILLQLKLNFDDIMIGILKCVVIDLYYNLYFLTEEQKYMNIVLNMELFKVELFDDQNNLIRDISAYIAHYNLLLSDMKFNS